MKSLQYLFIVGLLFSSIGYSQTVPSYEPTNGLVAAGDVNFGTETTTFKLLVECIFRTKLTPYSGPN
jgi:hypothetical protein